MSKAAYQAQETDRRATDLAFELQAARQRIRLLRDKGMLRLMNESLRIIEAQVAP